jgi:hypothetical protein
MSSLLLESVCNKPSFRGKYMPCVISSLKKCNDFIKNTPKPEQKNENKKEYNLLELYLYKKYTNSSYGSFKKALKYVQKCTLKMFKGSQYADYILSSLEKGLTVNKTVMQLQKV